MAFNQLKNRPFFKIITNIYVMISIVFIVWMLFFDRNTYLNDKLGKEIEELESTINFYEKKNKQNHELIKNLQDSLQLERFAREKYLMKKDNEDIYIIEFDTIK